MAVEWPLKPGALSLVSISIVFLSLTITLFVVLSVFLSQEIASFVCLLPSSRSLSLSRIGTVIGSLILVLSLESVHLFL